MGLGWKPEEACRKAGPVSSLPYRQRQGRMKRKGTRNGMMVREHPQVQKLKMIARKMMMRMVMENIQHPPRRRRTK